MPNSIPENGSTLHLVGVCLNRIGMVRSSSLLAPAGRFRFECKSMGVCNLRDEQQQSRASLTTSDARLRRGSHTIHDTSFAHRFRVAIPGRMDDRRRHGAASMKYWNGRNELTMGGREWVMLLALAVLWGSSFFFDGAEGSA